MRALLVICFIFVTNTIVHAEPDVEMQIKNAFLTLSAFECAVVSPNDKETERLFTIGLKAGRDFVQFVRSNPDLSLKTIMPKVPILWSMTSGPTADFIIGRIYEERMNEVMDEIYKKYPLDEELRKMKKQDIYQTKNCALLGQK